MKYYRCSTCNLTFKDFQSAVEHKSYTIHTITEEHFPSRYGIFPPFVLEKKEDSLAEVLPFEDYPIGESTELYTGRECYLCLTCRLRFKDRYGAEKHRFNSRHKVVKENYPIGPPYPSNFENIVEIIGENIDYDSFFQRTIDEVPNED